VTKSHPSRPCERSEAIQGDIETIYFFWFLAFAKTSFPGLLCRFAPRNDGWGAALKRYNHLFGLKISLKLTPMRESGDRPKRRVRGGQYAAENIESQTHLCEFIFTFLSQGFGAVKSSVIS